MHQVLVIPSGGKEGAETFDAAQKSRPQRLKPFSFRGIYGTAEAVPLTKTRFFSIL
jgi:hypothetical protein